MAAAPQKLAVFGDVVYGSVATNQAAVNAALTSAYTAAPISVIYVHQNNQVAAWVAAWAQANGVPFVSLANDLAGAGYVEPTAAAVQFLAMANPDSVQTFGSTAAATVVQQAATAKGKSLTAH